MRSTERGRVGVRLMAAMAVVAVGVVAAVMGYRLFSSTEAACGANPCITVDADANTAGIQTNNVIAAGAGTNFDISLEASGLPASLVQGYQWEIQFTGASLNFVSATENTGGTGATLCTPAVDNSEFGPAPAGKEWWGGGAGCLRSSGFLPAGALRLTTITLQCDPAAPAGTQSELNLVVLGPGAGNDEFYGASYLGAGGAILATDLTNATVQCGVGAVSTPTNTPQPPTATPTRTNTPTNTATATPTRTNTPVPPTPTATNTPVPPTPTATNTPQAATATPTNSPVPPTATPTSSPVPPTATPTPSPVPPTPTATNTQGAGPTDTPTNTPLPTDTPVPTATPTNTVEPTATNTSEPTPTDTAVPTATDTPVGVPTATNTSEPTPTDTPVPTATDTPVPTATDTPVGVPTATDTPQPTATATNTPTATGTAAPASTLDEAAAAGATSVTVADGSGFDVGDVIKIGGDATEELNQITGISSVPLVGVAPVTGPAVLELECPLQFSHPAGSSVAVVQETFECQPTPTDTPIPTATATNTPGAVTQTPVTSTPVVTRTVRPTTTAVVTRTVVATKTVVATRTVVPTATREPEHECMTLGEKFFLVFGILKHFGAQEGHWRYKAQYDLNDDGKINWKDLEIVFDTPLCRKHRH